MKFNNTLPRLAVPRLGCIHDVPPDPDRDHENDRVRDHENDRDPDRDNDPDRDHENDRDHDRVRDHENDRDRDNDRDNDNDLSAPVFMMVAFMMLFYISWQIVTPTREIHDHRQLYADTIRVWFDLR